MMKRATGADLAPGQVIAGRFCLTRLLGKGGMGSVWVARHLTLNVDVALKFIDAAVARRGDVLSRFAQEAQAAAQVKSPHVVQVLDYGADSLGRPYIAMELLQGEELARRLERTPYLPIGDVCRVVMQACRGLQRAHAAGIVHRDLKPENLFLVDDEEGFVTKVLDFGIAKANSPVGAVTHHTGAGEILGTPLYMSPEQALGNVEVDFRTDLYSLAVVAFHCLTGTVPFVSEALGELIVKVSTEPVPPARALRPDLPPAVDAWFARALHKDPARRFSSAREMGDTFLQACGAAAWAFAAPEPPASVSMQAAALHSSEAAAVLQAALHPSEAAAALSRGPATLMGATAPYSPPVVRPWLSYGAATLFGTVFVCLLFFFKPFGQESAARARALPQAQSGEAAPASSTRAAGFVAKPNAPPVAAVGSVDEPAPPPPEAPPAAAAGRRSPEVEAPARPRAPRPTSSSARPPAPKNASPPAKSKGIDWGIE
jgi:eukaryotic-like serine/threonine-protein kinase